MRGVTATAFLPFFSSHHGRIKQDLAMLRALKAFVSNETFVVNWLRIDRAREYLMRYV